MSFADIQAAYAAHRIATYPLSVDEASAVEGVRPHRRALQRLTSLALPPRHGRRLLCARNNLTVVDIDSSDSGLVDEIQGRHGAPPLHISTPRVAVA